MHCTVFIEGVYYLCAASLPAIAGLQMDQCSSWERMTFHLLGTLTWYLLWEQDSSFIPSSKNTAPSVCEISLRHEWPGQLIELLKAEEEYRMCRWWYCQRQGGTNKTGVKLAQSLTLKFLEIQVNWILPLHLLPSFNLQVKCLPLSYINSPKKTCTAKKMGSTVISRL